MEHEIEDEEVSQVVGFPFPSVDNNEIYKLETPVTEEQCKVLVKSTGSLTTARTAADLELPVTSYSGVWKLKLQLCAAQLMNCVVLMLMSLLITWTWITSGGSRTGCGRHTRE